MISRNSTSSPCAWKRKWPGLDDPGVHRADGHFVHLLPVDAEERIGARVRARPRSAPAGVVRGMAPQRLEPRMALGTHAALLGDLPLEGMRLRAVRRERRVAVGHDHARRRRARPRASSARTATSARPVASLRHPEERRPRATRPARPRSRCSRNRSTVSSGTAPQRTRRAGCAARLAEPAHGALPPSAAAARVSAAWIGAGMYTPSISTAPASAIGPATSHRLSRTAGTCRRPARRAPCPGSAPPCRRRSRPAGAACAMAIHACPPSTAARRIVNSLRNRPNGGEPVTAKRPGHEQGSGDRQACGRGRGYRRPTRCRWRAPRCPRRERANPSSARCSPGGARCRTRPRHPVRGRAPAGPCARRSSRRAGA